MIDREHKLPAIALDIETAPLDNAADAFDESAVKVGHLKDPAKIKAKIDQARDEFVNRAALNWLTGRITCVCMYNDEVQHKMSGRLEATILDAVWEILSCYRTVVTYNGHSFDMQYLLMRSMVHGLPVDYSWRGTKYVRNIETDKHVDLINIYDTCGSYNSMANVARAILGDEKIDADPIELWDQRKFRELERYCLKDAEITWRLWRKISGHREFTGGI